MDIVILKFNPATTFESYLKYLPLISEERRNKIDNLKQNSDKVTSLLTELLMRSEISKRLSIPFSEIVFFHNDFGKPYIKQDDFHFSVSHSDKLIAFAASTAPVGIDIEKVIEKSDYFAMHFFTDEEKEYINSSPDRTTAFYQIWTKKEAYIKMSGQGLSLPMKSFNSLTLPIVTVPVLDHILSAFSDKNISPHFTFLSEKDLLSSFVFLD